MLHVLCRDERSAGYMADAYARVSGTVGVCEGPSGGGATYMLPGVVEANESSIPILAISTDIAVSARGKFTLTELDQTRLFAPLTKWNSAIDRSADVPRLLRRAFVAMTTGRPGSVHLSLPFDVQKGEVDAADVWAHATQAIYPARRTAPQSDAVAEAARMLKSAHKALFICGGGVISAHAEQALVALAERVGAGVATTISGKGSIPEDHPLAVGVVGSNGGTPETRSIVAAADTIVFLGCRAGSVTTERWRYPRMGQAPILHIDVDPAVIGANYKTDCVIVADAALALDALLRECEGYVNPHMGELVEMIAAAKRAKFNTFIELSLSQARPIRPERIVAALRDCIPEDFILVADAGTPCPYLSAYFELKKTGRQFITNRAHGALGYALSAAIGAQFARPQSKVVAVMGDGSFGFTCGELETALRHKLPITFIVLSNATYGWIKAGQKTAFGGRYYGVDFSRTDHAAVGRAFGVESWTVENPHEVEATIARAIAHQGPSLVDIITQPLHEAHAPVSEWIA